MEEQEEEFENKLLSVCRQIHNQIIGLETLSQYCDIDKFDIDQLNDILFQLQKNQNECKNNKVHGIKMQNKKINMTENTNQAINVKHGDMYVFRYTRPGFGR